MLVRKVFFKAKEGKNVSINFTSHYGGIMAVSNGHPYVLTIHEDDEMSTEDILNYYRSRYARFGVDVEVKSEVKEGDSFREGSVEDLPNGKVEGAKGQDDAKEVEEESVVDVPVVEEEEEEDIPEIDFEISDIKSMSYDTLKEKVALYGIENVGRSKKEHIAALTAFVKAHKG